MKRTGYYAVPVTLYHEGEYVVRAESVAEAEAIVRGMTPVAAAERMEEFLDHGIRTVKIRARARVIDA